MAPLNQSEPPALSFELNQDMLDLLRREFAPPSIVEKFAAAAAEKDAAEAESTAEGIFGEFGGFMGHRCYLPNSLDQLSGDSGDIFHRFGSLVGGIDLNSHSLLMLFGGDR